MSIRMLATYNKTYMLYDLCGVTLPVHCVSIWHDMNNAACPSSRRPTSVNERTCRALGCTLDMPTNGAYL